MRILLMGRKQACRDLLEYLITEGHEVAGVVTDSHLNGSVTTARALEIGIPVMTLEEVVSSVDAGSVSYDLGLSMVFWRKIPHTLIETAPLGVVNFHPAPLPEYKGTAGYNLAILEGLNEWAVSAHYVDESIDTGEIIEVDRFSISHETETVESLESESMRRLFAQAKRVVSRITMEGALPTQPNRGGRYVSRQQMEEMKRIRPGDDIERKIRAFWFPPYRGATIELEGKEYTLVSDEILSKFLPEGRTSLLSSPTTQHEGG